VRRLKRAAGFTLLELIITFTILSLIFVMVLGALRLGSRSWERGEEKAEKYQERRIIFNLLSQQVRSAFPYRVKATKAEPDYVAFLGKNDSLRFVSAFSLKARRPEGLVFVIYQVDEEKSSGKGLKIYERRVLNKDFMEETPEQEQFINLIEGLSDFTFEYFGEAEGKGETGDWVESWDGKEKKELPRQIRMNIKWREKKEELERTFPGVVSVPAYLYEDRGKAVVRTFQRPVVPRR